MCLCMCVYLGREIDANGNSDFPSVVLISCSALILNLQCLYSLSFPYAECLSCSRTMEDSRAFWRKWSTTLSLCKNYFHFLVLSCRLGVSVHWFVQFQFSDTSELVVFLYAVSWEYVLYCLTVQHTFHWHFNGCISIKLVWFIILQLEYLII